MNTAYDIMGVLSIATYTRRAGSFVRASTGQRRATKRESSVWQFFSLNKWRGSNTHTRSSGSQYFLSNENVLCTCALRAVRRGALSFFLGVTYWVT